MSQVLEFEGKNIDQAVEKACDEVKIPKGKLKYDVLSYGSSGIFGLVGSKKARIRVILQQSSETEATKKDQKTMEPQERLEMETPPENTDPGSDHQEDLAINELVAWGEEALNRIVNSITSDTQIDVASHSEEILYNVRGGNSALLIGKRGQTLEAIQYLVEKIVHRKTEKRIRVRVDVEGYQETRRINLERLAEKVAEKVKKTGKPVALVDMNASDRRIVHLTFKNDQEICTQSKGGGALKKLFIIPRKKQPPKT